MKKQKPSKKDLSSQEFAATAYTVYTDLIKAGFSTEQAFQLTRDVVEAIVK
jgi:hypothetical protein